MRAWGDVRMYIIMMSDLHIGGSLDCSLKNMKYKIDRMYNVINEHILLTDKILILMCGDVIDKGTVENYKIADELFKYIKIKSGGRLIEFAMIPGNHDMDTLHKTGFKAFDNFVEKFQKDACKFSVNTCYSKNVDDLNFVLANSAYHKDPDYGKVDIEGIVCNLNKFAPNILVTHHSTISEDETDGAAIRDMPCLIEVINKNNVIFHLHGHTHGMYQFVLGTGCYSIGVGTMFLQTPGSGSQFNLIELNGGKIDKIENYVYMKDRHGYIPNLLYPKNDIKMFQKSQEIIERIYYKCPPNYICRMVAPFKIVQEGSFSILYNKEQQGKLSDICIDKKRVILIGEAGTGKTIELQYLAHVLYKKDFLFPVFISLNSYVDETVDELIPTEYKEVSIDKLVFIFDGFDEIESKNLNTFARRINKFITQHEKTIVVVSSRNNFYKNALDETNVGTFNDFSEYALCPLEKSTIKEYINEKINSEKFLAEVDNKKLDEQINNPFYLVELVKLYSKEGKLPDRNKVMEKLIGQRFLIDEFKYRVTIDIEEKEVELFILLEELAFSMQCLKRTYLYDYEYQCLINNSSSRELLRYSGIWNKVNNNKLEFEHNNFREYLAARYLRNKKLDEIIQLVTYDDNKNEIKASWLNILSFLILIYKDDNLLNWVIRINPSIAINFEISRINEDTRSQILCRVLDEYKNKNMWISWNENNESNLALFGQSKTSINYLVKEIENPVHFRAQANAIRILKEFTCFFGQEELTKRCLINCCRNPNTRPYEIRDAIIALANNKLYSKDTATKLVSLFTGNDNDEIRYGMYCYIIGNNLQNEFIDYVLEGVELLKNRKENENVSERYRLRDLLCSVSDAKAIHKILTFLVSSEDYYDVIEYFKDILTEISNKAAKFFQSGCNVMLDDMRHIFRKASLHFESQSLSAAKEFFEKTNTTFETYLYVLDLYTDEDLIFVLENLMNNACIDDFAEKYNNSKLKNKQIFIQYVQRLRGSDYRYEELKNTIFKKDGIIIKENEIVDYNTLKSIGKQKYFDALFNKEEFQLLINELVLLSNGKNTCYDDLRDISFLKKEKRYELNKVRWCIERNKFTDNKAINFLNHVNWNDFSISCIYKELYVQNQINISEKQKNHIQEYCMQAITEIDFNSAFKCNKDGSVTVSWKCVFCTFFAEYFSFEYEHSIILDMLMIPRLAFKKDDYSEYGFSKYVLSRLTSEEIKERIIYNLSNKKIIGSLAENYLVYCMKSDICEAMQLAKSVINDIEYADWIRKKALNYIFKIKGKEYIYKSILPNSDAVLLKLISEQFHTDQDSVLMGRLIEKNEESKDGMLYLEALISRDSEYGLKKYLKLAMEKRTIPDYEEDNSCVCQITEAIGQVKEIKNLPIVIELCKLVFSRGFKDRSSFGLCNSVTKALGNICQENYKAVFNSLEKLRNENIENEELKSFCNHNIDDLKLQFYNQKDEPWSIDYIKSYFSSI